MVSAFFVEFPSDFEHMREESRFGPTTEKWATLWGGVVLQSIKCDAPYPSQFNWYSGNISIDGLNISNVGIRKKGCYGLRGIDLGLSPLCSIMTIGCLGSLPLKLL